MQEKDLVLLYMWHKDINASFHIESRRGEESITVSIAEVLSGEYVQEVEDQLIMVILQGQ